MVGARSAWQRLGANTVAHADRPKARAARTERPPRARAGGLADAGCPALIKKLSFSLEAGETLGIIGPSASGKTTLIRLMLGLWKPQAGVIRLDGADVALWDRDSLGQHVGYLPQDVELFAGTVAENIARLAAVDSHKVVEAARPRTRTT